MEVSHPVSEFAVSSGFSQRLLKKRTQVKTVTSPFPLCHEVMRLVRGPELKGVKLYLPIFFE